MKTWGTGIFDNDDAESVRREFNDCLQHGMSVYAAADRILGKISDPTNLNRVDRAAVYLALAALQLEHGVVQPKIKKHALTFIVSGEELEKWESSGPETVEARRKVLQALREKLNESQ
jgi:hypothetical protein